MTCTGLTESISIPGTANLNDTVPVTAVVTSTLAYTKLASVTFSDESGAFHTTGQIPVYPSTSGFFSKFTAPSFTGTYVASSGGTWTVCEDVSCPAVHYGSTDYNTPGNWIYPLGGGAGYSTSRIYNQSDATHVITSGMTADQFISTVSNAKAGDIIFIPSTVTVDLTNRYRIPIPAGVTICGDRGDAGSTGGTIYRDHHRSDDWNDTTWSHQFTFLVADNVRVTGLNVVCTDMEEDEPLEALGKAFRVAFYMNTGCSMELDNCEVYGWSYSGILTLAGGFQYMHHNYMHHCHARGFGYCLTLQGVNAYALVIANVFDWTRHALSTTGDPTQNWEACYNTHLGHGNAIGGHHFDSHGYASGGVTWANGLIYWHHNTFLRPGADYLYAARIRGKPYIWAYLLYNRYGFVDSGGCPIEQKPDGTSDPYGHITISYSYCVGVYEATSCVHKGS